MCYYFRMNVIIIGNCSEEFVNLIKKSKLLDKLYVINNNFNTDLPSIKYQTLEELVQKLKALQTDVVIVTDKEFIIDGSVEYLKSNFINVLSPNQKWFNLEKSRLIAKQLLTHYSINVPKTILAPKIFPLLIKSDSPFLCKIANSMDELVLAMQKYRGEKIFLEDILEGDVFSLLVLWDGKSARYYINSEELTEVQLDKLSFLQTKFNFLLSDEKANFIGFFNAKLIWAQNDWHVLDFEMCFNDTLVVNYVKEDFLFLVNLAIYQKIDDIR